MDQKQLESNIQDEELFCDVCGMTYKEFLETGVFRCENCYRVFKYRTIQLIKDSIKNSKKDIKPRIKKVEANKISEKLSSSEIKERIKALEKLLELAQKVDDKEKIKQIEDEIQKLNKIEMEH